MRRATSILGLIDAHELHRLWVRNSLSLNKVFDSFFRGVVWKLHVVVRLDFLMPWRRVRLEFACARCLFLPQVVALCVELQVTNIGKFFAAVCVQNQVFSCSYYALCSRTSKLTHWGLRYRVWVHPRFFRLFIVNIDWGDPFLGRRFLWHKWWLGLRLWFRQELSMRFLALLHV